MVAPLALLLVRQHDAVSRLKSTAFDLRILEATLAAHSDHKDSDSENDCHTHVMCASEMVVKIEHCKTKARSKSGLLGSPSKILPMLLWPEHCSFTLRWLHITSTSHPLCCNATDSSNVHHAVPHETHSSEFPLLDLIWCELDQR